MKMFISTKLPPSQCLRKIFILRMAEKKIENYPSNLERVHSITVVHRARIYIFSQIHKNLLLWKRIYAENGTLGAETNRWPANQSTRHETTKNENSKSHKLKTSKRGNRKTNEHWKKKKWEKTTRIINVKHMLTPTEKQLNRALFLSLSLPCVSVYYYNTVLNTDPEIILN